MSADDDAWLYGDDDSKGGAVEPPGAEDDAPPAETVTEAGDATSQPGDQSKAVYKMVYKPPPTEISNGGETLEPPPIDENDATANTEEADAGDGEGQMEEADEENMPHPPLEADEDDDSDDDIEITIDKDKIEAAKTSYQNMQMKKASHEFAKEKKGKFAVEEMDQVGTINGESAVEFDMESLEEKPWRKPGADITDYFNYGFTEETWTAYCNRQKILRGNEAGVAVLPSAPILTSNKGGHTSQISSIMTTPSNLSNIQILGGGEFAAAAKNAPTIVSTLKPVEAKSLVPSGITVMTHDKRIYSSKTMNSMDFSLPPPALGGFSMPPPGLGSEPPPTIVSTTAPVSADEFSASEFPASEFPPAEAFADDPYSGGFNEPTAEAQWNVPPPTHFSTSLPPPGLPPPTVPSAADPYSSDPRYRIRDSRDREREDRDRYRDYDRDRRSSRRRSRSRDREREIRERRDRDRYADRDRTRVKRERRSRSRSRSPRSHKKSRSDRERKRESADREEQVKIKEEPEDSAPVAPPGEN